MSFKAEIRLPVHKLSAFTRGHNVQVTKGDMAVGEHAMVVFPSMKERNAFARAIRNGRGYRLSYAKGVHLEAPDGQRLEGGAINIKSVLRGTKDFFSSNDAVREITQQLAPALTQAVQQAALAAASAVGAPGAGPMVGRVAGRAAKRGVSKALDKELGDGTEMEGEGLRAVARSMHGRGFKDIAKGIVRSTAKPLTKVAVSELTKIAGEKVGLDTDTTKVLQSTLGNAAGNAARAQVDQRLSGSGFKDIVRSLVRSTVKPLTKAAVSELTKIGGKRWAWMWTLRRRFSRASAMRRVRKWTTTWAAPCAQPSTSAAFQLLVAVWRQSSTWVRNPTITHAPSG